MKYDGRIISAFVGILLLISLSACDFSPGEGWRDPSAGSGHGQPASSARSVKPNIEVKDSSLTAKTLVLSVELVNGRASVTEQDFTADVPSSFYKAEGAPIVVRLEDDDGHILFEGGMEDPTIVNTDKWDAEGKISGSEKTEDKPVSFFVKIPMRSGATKVVFYRTLFEVVAMEHGGAKLEPYSLTAIGSAPLRQAQGAGIEVNQ